MGGCFPFVMFCGNHYGLIVGYYLVDFQIQGRAEGCFLTELLNLPLPTLTYSERPRLPGPITFFCLAKRAKIFLAPQVNSSAPH